MTVLSRNLSHGSRGDEGTAAAHDLEGLGQPQFFRTQTSRSPGWTMMTVDKSMMKDISRMVTPFIDELDTNVNTKINGVMRHLSASIETISSRVEQLAARVNKLVPQPHGQYEKPSDLPAQAKPAAAIINPKIMQTTRPGMPNCKPFERRPGLQSSILIPTQAVSSQQTTATAKKKDASANPTSKWQAVAPNKYFIQRNERKLSNMAVTSSKSIADEKKVNFAAFQVSSGDMKANELDNLQKKRKMSSNRLREKREEVLMKRRKSQGYMSRKSSEHTLQGEQQLERR